MMIDGLVIWSLSTTTSHPSITKFHYVKVCSAPVMKGGGWWHALRLDLLLVVVPRWSKDIFVFFVTFRLFFIDVEDY